MGAGRSAGGIESLLWIAFCRGVALVDTSFPMVRFLPAVNSEPPHGSSPSGRVPNGTRLAHLQAFSGLVLQVSDSVSSRFLRDFHPSSHIASVVQKRSGNRLIARHLRDWGNTSQSLFFALWYFVYLDETFIARYCQNDVQMICSRRIASFIPIWVPCSCHKNQVRQLVYFYRLCRPLYSRLYPFCIL